MGAKAALERSPLTTCPVRPVTGNLGDPSSWAAVETKAITPDTEFLKAPLFNVVTVAGIRTTVAAQYPKAVLPTLVRPSFKVMVSKVLGRSGRAMEKALDPRVVTVLGSTTALSWWFKNALPLMTVSPSDRERVFTLHPAKALAPIVATFEGIFTSSRAGAAVSIFRKAPAGIAVRASDRCTLVTPSLVLKAAVPIS